MNPLRDFLERHKMTGEDLTLLSGLSLSRVYAVLNGVCVFPNRLLPVIEKAGENAGTFLSDYESYREERQEESINQVGLGRVMNRTHHHPTAMTEPETVPR